jgi:hypothetical protein
LQPNSPFHHWVLAYVVVGSVVAAMILCGLLPASKARRALLSVAAAITFLLNLSAFDTLLARDDASYEFVAGLVGARSHTLRACLVLLLATFVSLLTLCWYRVLGVREGPRASSGGENMFSTGEPGHTNLAAAAPRGSHTSPAAQAEPAQWAHPLRAGRLSTGPPNGAAVPAVPLIGEMMAPPGATTASSTTRTLLQALYRSAIGDLRALPDAQFRSLPSF